jgi:hypothetical protein
LKNQLLITRIFGLLALSIAVILFFMRSNDAALMQKEISDLKNEIAKAEDDYLALDATMISLNDLNVHMGKELEMFRNPDNRMFFLKSNTVLSKEATGILCWNKKDFSIQLSVESLPEKEKDEHYYLWAFTNNKTIGLGALPSGINSNFYPLKITFRDPVKFAITLEEKGKEVIFNSSNLYLESE